MNKPLRLPLALAVAFALGSPQVHALGLGQIEVRSALNQPLVAEIPVIEATPGEAKNLTVKLASPDAFARVGLDRPALQAVNLSFEVDNDARGRRVIRVTTPSNVVDPFMSFLLEADWGKGKILREYTVLLDPPAMTPIAARPQVSSAPDLAAPAPSQSLDARIDAPPRHDPAPPDTGVASSEPVGGPAQAAAHAAGDQYTVAAGDTLWEIAQQARPDDSININQMMMALLRANPEAFIGNNINRLKKGAVLRIPGRDEAAELSAAQAAAQVRDQIQAWGGPARTLPQPADASITHSAATPSARRSSDSRLELTPPRDRSGEGSASQSGASGDGGGRELRAELNRSQEEVSALTQENIELKSRVTELEQIQSDSRRLLELKDSELAAAQRRLAELEAAAGLPPSTPQESTPVTTADEGKAPGEAEAEAAASSLERAGAALEKAAAKVEAGLDEAVTEATQTLPEAASEVMPGNAPPEVAPEPVPEAAVEPASESVSEPIALAEKPAPSPAPAAREEGIFGLNPLLLGGAGIGLAGLIALLLLRRRKAQQVAAVPAGPAPRAHSHGPVGESAPPLSAAYVAAVATSAPHDDQEEAELNEAIEQYPEDLHLHLDLLRHYFARGNAAAFEQAAEAMHAQVRDVQDASWQEALVLGRQIVPNHPLFGGTAPAAGSGGTAAGAVAGAAALGGLAAEQGKTGADEMDWFAPPPAKPAAQAAAPAAAAAESDFDFDFNTPSVNTPPPPRQNIVAEAAARAAATAAASAPAAARANVSSDPDAAATKLELARAYLDMGDSDGARGMLEEVMNEGDSEQRKEAKELLDGIF